MKRYYYNNWLAKLLLRYSSCHTIAIAWFVLSKRHRCDVSQYVENHETTHAMQWTEVTMAIGLILLVLQFFFEFSPLWMLTAGIAYYVWYVLEWLCKLPFGNAYRSISFEQEAYDNELDLNYCEFRPLFSGWINKVFTIKRKNNIKI